MKTLFADTRLLDAAAKEKYALTDDVMMENAAAGLEKAVKGDNVFIVCGSGDNGGDGYALARRLPAGSCVVWSISAPKSESCKRQRLRAEKAGVPVLDGGFPEEMVERTPFTTIVDCIFGSGFHGEPDDKIFNIIKYLNFCQAHKVACDVPSCLSLAGTSLSAAVFRADVTVTMGALKTILYEDASKDYVGQIVCVPLGIPDSLFEGALDGQSSACDEFVVLLEETDLKPPYRKEACVHKGTYGHGVIITGNKHGAGIIAGSACFAYGAGLVTLVPGPAACPPELMQSDSLPSNTAAVAMGMGLGRDGGAEELLQCRLKEIREKEIPVVLDADALCMDSLPVFLNENCGKVKAVLTPHPKEFLTLLINSGLINRGCAKDDPLTETDVQYVVRHRSELAAVFCRKYPEAVLLVKGASPLISVCDPDGNLTQFVNPLGRNCLAKGGSGDVLSGLICALLAQGYAPLMAAVQGSLAHAMASRKIAADYGMTPFMLIEAARNL